MAAPNLFLVHVTDVDRATAFYADLFEIEPTMVTPRYVAFDVGGGALFALWSARAADVTRARELGAPRLGEVGLMVSGAPASVDATFERWREKGADVVEEPHDDVFGRTFVVADPDGNLVRVSPID